MLVKMPGHCTEPIPREQKRDMTTELSWPKGVLLMRRLYVSTVALTPIRACDSRAADHRHAGRQ